MPLGTGHRRTSRGVGSQTSLYLRTSEWRSNICAFVRFGRDLGEYYGEEIGQVDKLTSQYVYSPQALPLENGPKDVHIPYYGDGLCVGLLLALMRYLMH